MNRIAIALNTKDRTEQVRRIIAPLLPLPIDLFLYDGSDTEEGQNLHKDYPQFKQVRHNVKGSGDNAAVLALTEMLAAVPQYTHVGIVEDDVLLPKDWLQQCMQLFAIGKEAGMAVGAVSARAYEDRVLLQCDGYAVMHNLGWGQLVLTREAAFHTLHHYRTGWTTENRRVFAQLSGVDIGGWWAFRAGEHWICSDWGNDAVLAQYGLASLALVPSPVEMLGQNPPLEAQGLRLAVRANDLRRDQRVFDRFVDRLDKVRLGKIKLDARPVYFRLDDGGLLYFAHQLGCFHAQWKGDWSFVHNLGFGPFGFCAGDNASLTLDLSGPVEILLGPGKTGGSARIRDLASGYEAEPSLGAAGVGEQMFSPVIVPASVAWRTIVVDKLAPGTMVYGIRSRETQPIDPHWRFDATALPPVALTQPKVLEGALS